MHLFTINKKEIVKNKIFEKVINEEKECCVVAMVGKTKISTNSKKQMLHSIGVESEPFFENDYDQSMKSFHIDTYYIKKERIILIHLTSLLNVHHLTALCEDMCKKENTDALKEMEHNQVKALLIIFSISHLILVNHPSSTFDISYIRLFQLLESLRLLLKPVISHLLMTECPEIPSKWAESSRPCSPRLLFLFQHSYRSNHVIADEEKKECTVVSERQFQLAMEDEIYKIMRKDRIITDISTNSLFAIPANQEFVFMKSDLDVTNGVLDDPLTYFSHFLANICDYTSSEILPKIKKYSAKRPSRSNLNSESKKNSTLSSNPTSHHSKAFQITQQSSSQNTLKSFVYSHVHVALTKGFHDNNSRNLTADPLFELSTIKQLFLVANQLHALIFRRDVEFDGKEGVYGEMDEALWASMHMEEQFSENLCCKLLGMAEKLYEENMPTHYNQQQHQQKLDITLKYMSLNSRGPSVGKYERRLVESCERWWKDGRVACTAVSAMGNPCVHRLHEEVLVGEEEDEEEEEEDVKRVGKRKQVKSLKYDSKSSDEDDKNYEDDEDEEEEAGNGDDGGKILKRLRHTSRQKFRVTCDCGSCQVDRDDPFSVKEANNNLFEHLRERCCRKHGTPFNFKTSDGRKKKRTQRITSKDTKSIDASNPKRQKERSENRSDDVTDNSSLSGGQYAESVPIDMNYKQPQQSLQSQREQRKKRTDKKETLETQNSEDHDFDGDKRDVYDGDDLRDENEEVNEDEEEDEEDDEEYDNDIIQSVDDIYYNDYNSILRKKEEEEYEDDDDEDDYDIEIKPYHKDSNDNQSIENVSKLITANKNINVCRDDDNNNSLIQNNIDDDDNEDDDDGEEAMYSSVNMVMVTYSSWSLMRIGKYDASRGIHQPNYTHQSSYLLPINLSNTSPLSHSTKHSKAYIGVEYECSKGHRFLLSSPHKLFKASLSGTFKETGNQLIKKDMPLFFPCTCRSGPNYQARLSRIHVVVPDTTEFAVNLRVRVRPNPLPCPIFMPEHTHPINLSPGWWVLRLPYAYYDGTINYHQPSDQTLLKHCKLLRGCLSFVQLKV